MPKLSPLLLLQNSIKSMKTPCSLLCRDDPIQLENTHVQSCTFFAVMQREMPIFCDSFYLWSIDDGASPLLKSAICLGQTVRAQRINANDGVTSARHQVFIQMRHSNTYLCKSLGQLLQRRVRDEATGRLFRRLF